MDFLSETAYNLKIMKCRLRELTYTKLNVQPSNNELLCLSNTLLLCAGVTEDEWSMILAAPYLRSDVMALRDLHLILKPVTDAGRPESTSFADASQHITEQQPNTKPRKTGSKPKWMKL